MEPAGSADGFVVIEDDHPEGEWPQRFRYPAMPVGLGTEEMIGFRELSFMGGAQPSAKQLAHIIRKSDKPVVVVDLRQEPHAYIAGTPVTWFRAYISDEDLGVEAMMSLQERFILSMRSMPTVTVDAVQWTGGQNYRKVRSRALAGAEVMSEADLCTKFRIGYKRFYVPVTPTTQQVEEFERFVAEMGERNVTLYFHCWDGSGRTTVFLTMYDIIRNGGNVTLEAIVKRQAAIGGVDINKLCPASSPEYPRSLKRKEFIAAYYERFAG